MGGTIVEVSFPAKQFALEHTLSTLETVNFEIEQMAATNQDILMPFMWIETEDRLALEDALTDDDSVADFQLIADLETDFLYQLEWVDHVDYLIRTLVEENGTILTATCHGDAWYLRLLFADHDAVRRTTECCEEQGIDFNIENIYEFSRNYRDRFGLTDTQQRALQLAASRGYYSIPRDVTTEDLAEELGVSHQALSERLRRGHGTLVDHVLVSGAGTPEPPEPRGINSDEDVVSE
ncbi:helix-turn-helix domain-containing protein [Haladaptatus pallidirubidus]|uniref:GAF and HTH_10 associated domain-containing protein n=1 Tax=Haladaptatus pallidirubidus TaxID=1008152 RepID=A0AAV3UR76_9EURY|nr:helix-turn-helix domain-containing protein [Haladaptatus pallidirubidus]